MKRAHLPAKLSRPSSLEIFPRPRLFRLLDRLRHRQIIWITGPPGCGKTSLASSYLDTLNLPCLWYQVDEGDADVATFFYYMGLAAKEAASRKRKPLPLLTPEYLQGIPAFTHRFFEDLYGRLLDSSTPYAVVLDNYQEIPDDSLLHGVISQACSQVPDGIDIILISRKNPPDVYVRLKANRLIEMIGWKELRFTLEESRGMVRSGGYQGIPAQVVTELHKKTDGWAAGIVLWMEGMKAKGVASSFPKTRVSEDVFQYFAKEIFNRTDPEVQEFLLKTSFLPRMSAEMARTLTGNLRANTVLAELIRQNYFTQEHEAGTPLYQYHPLFREFLQDQALQTSDLATVSSLQRDAAEVLESSGQTEDAMDLLVASGAWSDAVPIILNHAPDLISQGRWKTLEGWVRKVPEAVAETEPWLIYWLGICRLPFSPPESGEFFERAFKLFRIRRDTAGLFLSLSGLFDSTSYAFATFESVDRIIMFLERALKEFTVPTSEVEARLAASTLTAMVLGHPQHKDFAIWADRAFSLATVSPDVKVKVQTFQALVAHWLFSGEFSKAELVLDAFRELVRPPGVTPLLVIILRDLEAFYYWSTGAFEEGRKAAREGLELASASGVHLLDSYLLGHGAAAALSSGDMAQAEIYLKKMTCLLDNMPAWGKTLYYTDSIWASLIDGNLSKALANAEWCLHFSAESYMPRTETVHHIGYAIVLHELNREDAAAHELAEAKNQAEISRAPLAEFMCDLAEARFAFDGGDDQTGLTALRKAVVVGRERGYVNTYYWQPSVMAKLCKKALEAGIEVEYVQGLIERRDLLPDPAPYDCENWPWPLRVNTLGQFELLKDGEAVRFPVRAPRRVLSLLKVIIAFGRNGASEDQVTDTLWPDAEGDVARQAFETALHRLRRLLGIEEIILLREGHLNVNRDRCMVDAFAFEELLERAEATRSILLVEKAVALYAGVFLADDFGEPWAVSYRERLRSKFLSSVKKLGLCFEKNGGRDSAIECYQRALEVDNFAEEFYQLLMMLYRSEGRLAEALSTYDRCRNILKAVLGVEPSNKTKAIYDSLTRDR